MGQRIVTSVMVILLVMTHGRHAPAAVTDQQVREAIARGVEYLKREQFRERGNWSEYPGEPGGLTALCTLALLNAGVDSQDPAVAHALDYLRSLGPPQRTYSTALITMAFCQADPQQDLLLIRRNVMWLEAAQFDTSRFVRGAWGYTSRQTPGDNSNTQFALLALNEAQRVGVEVSQRTWRLALDHWQETQKPDGSWTYRMGSTGATRSTGSMTCAGIASMVIASGHMSSGRAQVQSEGVRCCGDAPDSDAIERGLRWLGRVFTVRANPGTNAWLMYYLYGVERVGRLTGRRFLGDHDWYREGCELLVSQQDEFNGLWRGVGTAEDNPLVATSLALLFLSKGRRPVVIGKAQYGTTHDWDLHTGGIPNLTRHVEQSWKRELTWQTIDLRAATVADLLEAPVLFLSGQGPLQLTRDQEDRLREYVLQGGFLFAEACDGNGCNGQPFDRSFRALMRRLFPDSNLRLLPPDHPVWFADGKVNADYLRPLYGIEACCRTSVVYCPRTLSCFWELSVPGRKSEYPEKVRDEIAACVQIGQNVVAYATNRNLKEKLERPNITYKDENANPTARGVLVIPKLSHGGGADDAPNALVNLMRFMRQEVQLRTLSERRLLPPTDPSLMEYPILFMHGRRSFRWNAAERQALADYVQNGGFLMADSICANVPFANAFRQEMEAIFPGRKLERIPVNHPLLSDDFGGFDLSSVTLNDPQRRQEGEPLDARQVKTAPLLEGLQVDGRLAVVFSPYDISCALESRTTLECKGYLKADAARIATNIILFALQQ